MNSDSKLKVSNKKQSKHKISEMYRSGQTALGRWPCQGGATTHLHRQSSLPARPHSAGCCVREEPQDTRSQAVFPAGQTALSRLPCQGRAARHKYTGGLPCWPDHTRQMLPCQGGNATQIHMWPTQMEASHSLKYYKLTSLDAIFIQGTVNHHN